MIPNPIERFYNVAYFYIDNGIKAAAPAITALLTVARSKLLESNPIGRRLGLLLAMILEKSKVFYENSLWDFVGHSVGVCEGRMDAPAWREDVFSFARYLLTNSAVFLLVLVTLFSLTAKFSRPSHNHDDTDSSTSVSEDNFDAASNLPGPPGLQESSSSSPDSTPRSIHSMPTRKMTRSLSPVFATIDEGDEELGDDSVLPNSNNKKNRLKGIFRRQMNRQRNGGSTALKTSLSM